jgi:hypothetical protein
MKVLWLATGAAVGYVVGTKAGRERYDRIMVAAREWADKPGVTEAVKRVSDLAGRGKDAATAKLPTATDDAAAVVTPQTRVVRATPTTG